VPNQGQSRRKERGRGWSDRYGSPGKGDNPLPFFPSPTLFLEGLGGLGERGLFPRSDLGSKRQTNQPLRSLSEISEPSTPATWFLSPWSIS
jgi:hypothetical protein